MLKSIAWAMLTVLSPAIARPATCIHDSIQVQQQDTVSRKKPGIHAKETSPQEQSPFLRITPFGTPSGPEANRRPLGGMVDSLLRYNPQLKAPLLKELLIPSALQMRSARISELDSLNQQLMREGKFSALERMGLIARHYSVVNPNAKSFSTHQIDIIGTVIWLGEVLK